MRDEFVRALTDLAQKNKNLVLITGDLGFGVLTRFAGDFPGQFINAGVAEQNMTGIAVGMSLEGKIVFTYSIANFPTLRCLEQIRNDACYHQANVKIVAVGGGFSYGALGMSHHATEDLAIMRSLPNIVVVAPGDTVEAAAATRAVFDYPGTCYLRLGRGGEPKVHEGDIEFKIGKAIKVREGEDVALISTGGILKNAVDACTELRLRGINAGLYSLHTLKPIDQELIEHVSREVKLIVTIEEHTVIGGLGGSVAEILAQLPGPRARLKMIGLRDCFSEIVGDQEYLRSIYGMSADSIVRLVENSINIRR